MSESKGPVKISTIPTGVPNLDPILGGGIPEGSLTVIAGPAGAGKTTLAQQIAFHSARPEKPALFFTTLGEPTIKMLRYQQQFSFFDPAKVGSAVHFIDLSMSTAQRGLSATLNAMRTHVQRLSPGLVAVDSFRALEEFVPDFSGRREFVHEFAVLLSVWQACGLLVGEYTDQEVGVGPDFTVVDNVIHVTQELYGNMAVRRLLVLKMRGLASQPGRRTFRITGDGIEIFPRLPEVVEAPRLPKGARAQTGIAGLDQMMRGGIPRGQTCIVAGSSGAGKTLLALHFAVAGTKKGEPCVMATFEESPAEHAEKMAAFGWDLADLERRNLMQMVYLRPVDLTFDEVTSRIGVAVERIGAQRAVINSVSGLQTALPPPEQAQFRDGLYRLLASLTSRGVTVVLTTEVPDILGQVKISEQAISFLADNIVLLRYVEIASELRRALMVIKMRTSDHDKELREYRIGKGGISVEKPFSQYTGVLTGIPTLRTLLEPQPFTAGLTEQEETLMRTLLALRQASARELADSLGLPVAEVQGSLDKLTDTGYVLRSTRAGEAVYRVVLVTPGAARERR